MNRQLKRSRSVAITVALTITALNAPAIAAAQATRADLIARIDSIAQSPVRSGAVAGIAVAVVKGRDTLLMKGYGMADLEQRVPVTPTTVFRIGSLTKQFTSSAIMRLVEQRTISLDDDLTKYVSSYPTRGRAMPIRYLLNHTSGIPSYTDIGAPFERVVRLDLAPDSLIAIVANDSLQFEPGTHMYYNNTGYFLLGMVIEKATGATYADYLERTMFKPAGLSQTIYCDTRRVIPQRAHGYDRVPNGLVNADYIGMQLPYAAGSLCSTVGDLVSWTQQLNSGRIVSAASYRAMTTPVTLPSGRPMTYAYGLTSDTVAGHRVISHGGGINGFISFLLNAPQDSLIVAVLANTTPAPSGAVANDIMRVVLGLPPAPAPAAIADLALSAADRSRYVGDYALTRPDGTRQPMRVTAQGDQLMLQAAGAPPVRLRSQGGHAFVGMDGSRLIFDAKGDRATGFVFGTGSRRLEAVRTR